VHLQVDNLDEAIRLVNANEYGNGTAVFTRSGAAARKFQREVDVGMVSACSWKGRHVDVEWLCMAMQWRAAGIMEHLVWQVLSTWVMLVIGNSFIVQPFGQDPWRPGFKPIEVILC